MSQPFRSGNVREYRPSMLDGVSLLYHPDRIEVRSNSMLHTLSSAVHMGGYQHANALVNWKVPLDYECSDPVGDIARMCQIWGLVAPRTIGFMTAAKLTHASMFESSGDRFNLLCCTTLGTRNAARAGLSREVFAAYSAGTINTMLLIDGAMTESAMVNAIITATEAKAAALQELGIVERANGELATGTTTDAIAIAVTQSAIWEAVHAYAGTATSIGSLIGEAVYATVLEAGRTQHEE